MREGNKFQTSDYYSFILIQMLLVFKFHANYFFNDLLSVI